MVSMHTKDQAALAPTAGIHHPLHGHQGMKLPDEIEGHRGISLRETTGNSDYALQD
jgi:hypothetical protein